MSDQPTIGELVSACATKAFAAAPSLAGADDETIDNAIAEMAARLSSARARILAANAEDVAAAEANGMSGGLLDRLRITEARLAEMAEQLRLLASVAHPERSRQVGTLDGGLRLLELRRPVGVIGANYEARPNVTVDVASQLVKSRNGGVLRTGSAALRSATTLIEHVVAPALSDAGLDADAIQLVPSPDREAAGALVDLPHLVPLVILRGSGESTRELGRRAAASGVRTLAHADGGGVLYYDLKADPAVAEDLITRSLDRLGVCNRLNLLLVHRDVYDAALPGIQAALTAAGVTASLPPHDHAVGYEWALDSDREATVTVTPVDDLAHAARVANTETSGLAAGIVTADRARADEFIAAYTGTGVFWNAPTRLLDGFKLLGVPETGINIDRVPGPRGPVTFTDLTLRQYAVLPV
ncbi:aldehyde dehydrogenase family protein [Actinokineospora globicatena]|uniref:aldehyde dehydrogenase family protein n=1 Tax=Actinokineospora globicatena TaxID=103729 RepID=UPI0020A54AE3|nr:aldehyde dehydrogenase family protein [Actinokineospora globicatena]MCP2305111.1 glutamate-5-semialdehyde dehydrogenase [Actinokineospora globicatena]GLW80577.1 gamma-glutamyl-phosphate reductase [Actinokineospora globicatena]GLW87405.1 gamma-glutamyl-phosphate reductase [Actinokineospora globicatena]